jgi:hypothetical protein
VFSVASRAAFPEMPLASTQNLTIAASPDSSEYTKPRDAEPFPNGARLRKQYTVRMALVQL